MWFWGLVLSVTLGRLVIVIIVAVLLVRLSSCLVGFNLIVLCMALDIGCLSLWLLVYGLAGFAVSLGFVGGLGLPGCLSVFMVVGYCSF